MPDLEAAAVAAVDPGALAADTAALVRAASPTGAERPALERLADLAAALGLEAELVAHDLPALLAHPDQPGTEAPRDELLGLEIRLPAPRAGAPRIALNGHVDVVDAGTARWERDPFGGATADGFVHGRGSADMKGGVVAALHAMAAARGATAAEVVLQAVASEEDGGLGTFAALERDDAFDAALIPEPTAFAVVCAQAGSLTFTGTITGVAAHAAIRREGVSAIDRYLPVHAALAEHERRLNADVAHPLLRELGLPYPVLVGRLAAGVWSSTVPDRLDFEGRLGVRMEEGLDAARAGLEDAVRSACPDAEVAWTGGAFAPGQTAVDHPFVRLVQAAAGDELGAPVPLVGVPYGADMRLFCARGIPAVMVGPGGLERAHAVDERVAVDDLAATARLLTRVLCRFGRTGVPA
jgi:acetylornithine deacetylase